MDALWLMDSESIFARAACGCFEDNTAATTSSFEENSVMQRASVGRRSSQPGGSSGIVRSRSEERNRNADESLREFENEVEEKGTLEKTETMDDDDAALQKTEKEEFHDAVEGAAISSPSDRISRRAMSDPFDTPLSDGDMAQLRQADEEAEKGDKDSGSQVVYPTLPRYPVAATRDKNCWNEPPISIYSVRGANYLKDKKKVPSADYLCKGIGLDLFLTEDENLDIGARYVWGG